MLRKLEIAFSKFIPYALNESSPPLPLKIRLICSQLWQLKLVGLAWERKWVLGSLNFEDLISKRRVVSKKPLFRNIAISMVREDKMILLFFLWKVGEHKMMLKTVLASPIIWAALAPSKNWVWEVSVWQLRLFTTSREIKSSPLRCCSLQK